MFRLIASNTQAGLRPVLLRKVRSNKNGLLLGSNNLENFDIQTPLNFQRTNATSTDAPIAKVDRYIAKVKVDPHLLGAVRNAKVDHFEELLTMANQMSYSKDPKTVRHFFETVNGLFKSIKDELVRANLQTDHVQQYSRLLNHGIYLNRTSRLSRSSNRDSDQYHSSTLNTDVMLKSACLEFADTIMDGQFKGRLSNTALRELLISMVQFKAFTEMLNLWEAGVNDEQTSPGYLQHDILSVVLPTAYEEKRFTYEQILQVYELNTNGEGYVFHELLASMGKIAIKANDYSRGLDSLEALLQQYETGKDKRASILRSLGELHLSFIGSCKDIKIAKHFFDKVIDMDMPYRVVLKVPHIQTLIENCVETNEPYSSILYFWKTTAAHYTSEAGKNHLNSRYTVLNNTFFATFFKLFPELTEDSYNKLKEVISIYANLKPVDEFFLNTIVNNYSWNDKVVFQQLVDNYTIYNVNRTPVAYRVCLKKIGEIEAFTNEEILAYWNTSLTNLDGMKYRYIPIADWAALRDATIMSQYTGERSQFYLKVLDTYKNYHQDENACQRFVRYWLNRDTHLKDIARVSLESSPQFDCDIAVEIPDLKNLKENLDYKKITSFQLSNLMKKNT